MGLHDVQHQLVRFGGGFGPVHLDAVLGAFFLQLFKQLRQLAQGLFFKGISQGS